MNETITWLTTRRSVRRYQPHPIPDDLIEQLLTAAIWSPSAHNRQPWRFAVIRNTAVKEQLAQAMGRQLRADLEADDAPADVIARDVNRSYQRLTGAPLLILLSLSMEDMDAYPDPDRQRNEWTMAVQSAAMAGQNLLLAAHALGLGACWLCAPLFCPAVAREALSLPANWQPQGLITVGYPAERKEKTRQPLNGSVLFFT